MQAFPTHMGKTSLVEMQKDIFYTYSAATNVFKLKFQTPATKYSNKWTSNTLILLVEILLGSHLCPDFFEVLNSLGTEFSL